MSANEFIRPESLELARLSWENATGDVGIYDRLAALSFSSYMVANALECYELAQRPWGELPAGIALDLARFAQHARQFLSHGARAQRELRAAA